MSTATQSPEDAALLAQLTYGEQRIGAVDAEDWADLVDAAALWANATRLWLADLNDRRHDLTVRLVAEAMGEGASRTAAEKTASDHPDYRAAVRDMRLAEAMLALAEARQKHAELRATTAITHAA